MASFGVDFNAFVAMRKAVTAINRLFGAAELRLGGGKQQQTVRIVRTDGRPSS